MNKEDNIVYVKTKNGIYKCYKSEQLHKNIFYPVESKTNGFIDYNEVIYILSIDDLYNELKKQKEINQKAIEYIKENKEKYYQDWGQDDGSCDTYLDENEVLKLLQILEEKEV